MKKNMNITLVSQFYSTRMAKPNDHENFFLTFKSAFFS